MENNDINVLPQMPPVKAVFDSRFFMGVLLVAAVTLIGYYAGCYFYGWGFGLCGKGVKCVVDIPTTAAAGTGLNLS
jgi:hypothetical protein